MKLSPCLAILLLWAAPALANARLVKTSPANGAKVKSPAHIVLRFNEALEPAFSGALLLDQDGRNLTGAPVTIDGTVMRLSPASLPPGTYVISWEAVGHDGHPVSGHLHFTVRP